MYIWRELANQLWLNSVVGIRQGFFCSQNVCPRRWTMDMVHVHVVAVESYLHQSEPSGRIGMPERRERYSNLWSLVLMLELLGRLPPWETGRQLHGTGWAVRSEEAANG